MKNHLRQQYLKAIGIQNWQLKSSMNEDSFVANTEQEDEALSYGDPHTTFEQQKVVSKPLTEISIVNKRIVNKQIVDKPTADKVSQSISENRQTAVVDSNISSNSKVSDKTSSEADFSDHLSKEKVSDNHSFDTDSPLSREIKACKQCLSRNTRLNTLVGHGMNNASVVVIGGAPDAEEDRLGRYLVGSAESLFSAMLQSINLETNYFYTGILKCHSMNSFSYNEDDISHCSSYLHSQIDQIKPSILLVLGPAEAQALLQTKQSFNELRQKVHQIRIKASNYSVIVSYQPAYLLRNPLYKKESLKDLIMVKNLLQ